MTAEPHTQDDTKRLTIVAALAALFLPRSSPAGKLAMDDGPRTLRVALREKDLREHAAGRKRFGAIPFVDSEGVGWSCLDLDARLWGHEPDDPEVLAVVTAAVEILASHGIRAAAERSKSKGWHIWVFFDVPVQARNVRALLQKVACEAGAQNLDAADLVCPRQDRLSDIGNGVWLPNFGGDVPPHTHFYVFDGEAEEWLPAEDQAALLRDLAAHPSSASAVPTAQPEKTAGASGGGAGESACAWILAELEEHGVVVETVAFAADKIQFACPLHESKDKRHHGGSAVFFATGSGWCASARCNKRWRSVSAFLGLLGMKGETRALARVAADVEIREVEWLWESWLPRGKIAVVDGPPGLGKSTLTLDLAARITTGRSMPDGSPCVQGAVVMLNYEDDAEDTIVPRFKAAGGDAARLILAGEVQAPEGIAPLDLPDHVPLLEALVTKHRAVFVVVDPLMAALQGDVKTGIDHHVRRALAPLRAMAERTRAAVLLVRHLNKAVKVTDPILRGGGSIGIIGAARAGLVVGRDPDDPTLRVLARSKANLAPEGLPSIAYRVVGHDTYNVASIHWCGASDRSAEDLMAAAPPDLKGAIGDAVSVLREFLANGPQPAEECKRFAKGAGVAPRTLDRAKTQLGVLARPRINGAKRREWFWELPAVPKCASGDPYVA